MSINKESVLKRILLRIPIYIYLFIVVFPVIFTIITSIKPTSEFYTNIWGLPKQFCPENYIEAFVKGGIGLAMLDSLIVVMSSVAFQLLFSSMSGYALAKLKVPMAGTILVVLIASCMLPGEIIVIPEFIMASKLKILGTHMGLILTYIGWGLAMATVIFSNFFVTVPQEIIESARMDGAGEMCVFLRICTPLVKPAFVTCAVYNFITLWGELFWGIISLSNQNKVRTIPMAIVEFQGQFSTNWGPYAAAICIVLVPLILFFAFSQKYFIAGLTSGSVKG